MNWPDYLAMSVSAIAAIYVGARAYRALLGRGKAGCGSGCGSCSTKASAPSAPANLLTIGAAPGERRPDM
jgi:hypothetical protein